LRAFGTEFFGLKAATFLHIPNEKLNNNHHVASKDMYVKTNTTKHEGVRSDEGRRGEETKGEKQKGGGREGGTERFMCYHLSRHDSTCTVIS
jgi:hypothetical protein